MKIFLFLAFFAITVCISCSKKTEISPFSGNWIGSYSANNVGYGTWDITIDNQGDITGNIISSPGSAVNVFSVTGNVNPGGTIFFTAYISSGIQWKFSGKLSGVSGNGTWVAESIPGNPPNKIWTGNKQ